MPARLCAAAFALLILYVLATQPVRLGGVSLRAGGGDYARVFLVAILCAAAVVALAPLGRLRRLGSVVLAFGLATNAAFALGHAQPSVAAVAYFTSACFFFGRRA
ncbi:MAG: hypothetical protein AAGC46_21615 [Solirubrobacteraceae bacterium]